MNSKTRTAAIERIQKSSDKVHSSAGFNENRQELFYCIDPDETHNNRAELLTIVEELQAENAVLRGHMKHKEGCAG